MAVIVSWIGFVTTVALVLIPLEVAPDLRQVAKIAIASVAGYAVFAWRSTRVTRPPPNSRLLRRELLVVYRVIGAVAAAAVFLVFDSFEPAVRIGIATLTGFVAISTAASYIENFRFGADASDRFVTLILGLTVIAWMGFCVGIVYALILGEFDNIATAAVLLLLGTLAISFAAFTARALAQGKPVQVEGHWGGLGGGLGGWRVSQPAVLLILAMAFSGATATALIGSLPPDDPEAQTDASDSAESSDSGTEDDGRAGDEPEAIQEDGASSGATAGEASSVSSRRF